MQGAVRPGGSCRSPRAPATRSSGGAGSRSGSSPAAHVGRRSARQAGMHCRPPQEGRHGSSCVPARQLLSLLGRCPCLRLWCGPRCGPRVRSWPSTWRRDAGRSAGPRVPRSVGLASPVVSRAFGGAGRSRTAAVEWGSRPGRSWFRAGGGDRCAGWQDGNARGACVCSPCRWQACHGHHSGTRWY
jgi:hypothetical protein